MLADGLSPRALADHGVGLLTALIGQLDGRYSMAPPVIATQARVALGDHIGAAHGRRDRDHGRSASGPDCRSPTAWAST